MLRVIYFLEKITKLNQNSNHVKKKVLRLNWMISEIMIKKKKIT